MSRSPIAVAILLLLVPALPAQGLSAQPDAALLQPVALDVTGWVDERVLVPAHAPLPQMSSGIGPGSQIHVQIGDSGFLCSANFVWQDGAKLYLGTAGHCLLPTDKTATHGPGADFDASGVKVSVCVSACAFGGISGQLFRGTFVSLGSVAYARQTALDQDGRPQDLGNDFGLVEIPTSLHAQVRAALPVWGGPVTSTPAFVGTTTTVCHYGHGIVYGENYRTQARAGTGSFFRFSGDGIVTFTGAVASGDSGSPLITCQRDADGLHGAQPAAIITHTVLGLGTLSAGTGIAKAIEMAREANLRIALVAAS